MHQQFGSFRVGDRMVPALLDAQGRAIAIDTSILRAENPTTALQPVNPVVTSIVSGQQLPFPGVAEEVFTTATVDNVTFDLWTYGTEPAIIHDTRRPESAPYRYSDFTFSKSEASLVRRSWASLGDVRTQQNADPRIRYAVKKAAVARRAVLLDEERVVRDILVASGSYAVGNVLNIAGGAEWDLGAGDMYGDVLLGVTAITGATQLQPSDLKLFVPQYTYLAMISNPTFLARRANVQGAAGVIQGELASFLGIGEVIVRNVVGRTLNGDVGPLYEDVAVLFAPGDEGDYDREFGEHRFAARIAMNAGVASEPWLERSISSTVWPYDRESYFTVLNSSAGFLFTNTASFV